MAKPESKLLVTIDNVVYDLTTFKEIHPGGRFILEQYHEKDATDAFWNFHSKAGHDRKAQLKGVPIENPPPIDPMIKAYRELRKDLREKGWFEPGYFLQIYKGITCLAFLIAGLLLTYNGNWIIGAILCGIGEQQLGWYGHDACHHGMTKNRKLNNFLGYFFGNIINGFSVNWWKDRHNAHHAITNILDSDPDVDNLPLFVWSEYDLIRIAPDSIATTILPYQHWYFLPFTPSLKLIWCLQSILFVMDPSLHNKSLLKAIKAERITLAIHYFLLFLVCRMTPTFTTAVIWFLISEGIAGAGIALIVFMNHYALDQYTRLEGKDVDFVKLQTYGTKNLSPGLFMDWFSGGLNYQIEHHLFPTMPRHRYPALQPIIEKFCKDHNLPYMCYSFYDCLVATLQCLSKIAELYRKQTEKQSSVSK